MTTPLKLALMWHMHQPDYRDPESGQGRMPWVRLHATRAYFDMAWLLQRHPQVRCTFNYVPVLLDQLRGFVEGGVRDVYWTLTLKPARLLDDADRGFLLRHFFSVSWEACVRPRARYWSLLHKRGEEGLQRPVGDFSPAELRDLQVLFNLAWFGFAAPREYPLVAELEAKGRNFTEDEKRRLLDVQIAVMRRVIRLYRELERRGQVELTTTPFFHPILPLIVDSNAAGRAMPAAALPERFRWPEDATRQVTDAIRCHREVFGKAPAGMWPAEGSVSPEIVPILAQAGIDWIATDEAQLWRSLPEGNRRGALYRPYRLSVGGASVAAVFRDTSLSDLIGFTYSRNEPQVAVDDLIARLRTLHQAHEGADEPVLVTILLDGENPWEHYPESGRLFLTRLYEALAAADWLDPVRIVDHLRAHPPRRTLTRLHTGSWIGGDFHIWIGGAVENRAWEMLGRARAFYETQREAGVPPERLEAALHHLMVAEGSDWFWWYGDHFSSEQDADFDDLFRARLRAAYSALGAGSPKALDASLYPDRPSAAAREPRAFIRPRFDQESTYFDWVGAGIYELSGSSSSMYRAARYFVRLRYGFDLEHLYLRLDPPEDESAASLAGVTVRVRVHGRDDHFAQILLDAPERATLARVNNALEWVDEAPLTEVKWRHGVLEIGIPFSRLNLAAGEIGRLNIQLLRGRVELDRYPGTGHVTFVVPDERFEEGEWIV